MNIYTSESYMILHKITKKRNARPVLQNVSLNIRQNRIIGVVGDNGFGKTTLLQIMAGLLQPDSGEILRGTGKISFVPFREEFESWMKVKDAVKFYNAYYDAFDAEKAYRLLADNGIACNAKIHTLSRGSQERLFLILSISQDAQLYLMDEPLSGIDPCFKKDIRQFLLKNIPENATIVMATHLLRELEQLFDEVIFITKNEVQQMETDFIRQNYGKSIEQYYLEVLKNGEK